MSEFLARLNISASTRGASEALAALGIDFDAFMEEDARSQREAIFDLLEGAIW